MWRVGYLLRLAQTVCRNYPHCCNKTNKHVLRHIDLVQETNFNCVQLYNVMFD